jgi:hypothetical protein
LSRALRPFLYGLVAVAALFELGVFWLMLHPDVPPDYRAYYIDKTTTCLNQPVAGTYTLGQTIDFTPPGADDARPVKVCGWEGPVGDGTHAVGTSTRLRFVYPEPVTGALSLKLRMIAVKKDGQPTQRVEVDFNGTVIDTVTVTPDAPQDFTVAVPADLAVAANGRVELELRFPDSVKIGAFDPDNRRRSIKLVSAALVPA